MLIYPQTVKVKWVGTTKQYYLDKGYQFTNMFDEFDVDIYDLPIKSEKRVNLICDICGDNFNLKYSSIMKRKSLEKDYCPNCSPRTSSDRNKVTSRIKDEFLSRGLILTNDAVYVNQITPLSFTCSAHLNLGIQFVNYEKFKFSHRGCTQCGEERRLNSRKTPFDRIVLETESRGFLMKSKSCDYVNNKSKLLFECKTHGEFEIPWVDFQFNKHGCPSCSLDNMSGENHFNWCGGISSINSYIRDRISPWIKDSYKYYGDICFITGESEDLELHHHYNFHKIVKETFCVLSYEIKSQISEYTDEELTRIKEVALELHYKHGLGIPLRKDVHRAFHRKYGNADNSFEQLLDFRRMILYDEGQHFTQNKLS